MRQPTVPGNIRTFEKYPRHAELPLDSLAQSSTIGQTDAHVCYLEKVEERK